jgi:hypothetical protein
MAPPPAKGNPLNGHGQMRANGAADIRGSIDALNSMPDRIGFLISKQKRVRHIR